MTTLTVDFATLEVKIEDMRFCERCGGEQIFVFGWACEAGLVGCCLGCGEEKLVRWTRSNSEAA